MVRVRPIPRLTLHDELVQRLRNLITQDQLTPGSKINEKALCDAFGVSRTPLREALKVLASEGLVTLLPNRGATVSETTQKDVEEIFPILKELEGLGGRLACEHMTDEQIAQVEALHDLMEAEFEKKNFPEYMQHNQSIHDAILDGSGNHTLVATYRSLSGRIRRVRLATPIDPERAKQAIKEHEAMLAALKARDGEKLANLLAHHMDTRNDTLHVHMVLEEA